MTGLPEGYVTRAPTREDAEEVAALMVACQLANTGRSDVSLDELIDDWHGLDLAEEAVVVVGPDSGIVGYADVLNRSFVTVSVYGYVHPDHRGRGIGEVLVGWGGGGGGGPRGPGRAAASAARAHPAQRGRGLGGFRVGWGERWTRDHMSLARKDARVVVQHYVN